MYRNVPTIAFVGCVVLLVCVVIPWTIVHGQQHPRHWSDPVAAVVCAATDPNQTGTGRAVIAPSLSQCDHDPSIFQNYPYRADTLESDLRPGDKVIAFSAVVFDEEPRRTYALTPARYKKGEQGQ